ncbi:STM4015 family protein [Nonomuraea sp. NPDC004354]
MSIYQHLESFYGLAVRELGDDPRDVAEDAPGDAALRGAVPSGEDPGNVAWRVAAAPFDEEKPAFADSFERLLATVDPGSIRALVVGWWGAGWEGQRSDIPIAAITAAADRLTALEAVFVGDIVSEECEISWIEHGDVTPLLTAFPRLRRLDVRGGTGLKLAPVVHESLETLRFESGGLPAGVVRAVGDSSLPALRHLELWLGEENYSGDSRPADWARILRGERLPALCHLGLQDSELQDEVAAAVAAAPIVARLESLDLSMGTLSDTGAEALLSGQPLTHLRSLDLSHHYLSDAMQQRVRAALAGVEVDLSDRQDEDDEWRYVAVSE